MRICVPIMERSMKSVLALIDKANQVADILEIRIDAMQKLDLAIIKAHAQRPVIITNRRRAEGGFFSGTERARIRLLKEAVDLGAEYIDIEAGTQRALQEDIFSAIEKRGRATKAIISSHDFTGTPASRILSERLIKCSRPGCIAKIVTMAATMEDNLKTLGLIPMARKKGLEIIAFCMGPKGRLSRAVAPLLGSWATYASFEKGSQSAPGQLTVGEMKEVIRILLHG